MESSESQKPRVESLRSVKLFAKFDEEQIAAVQQVMRRRRVSSADVVFEQGADGDTLVVLVDGMLRVEVVGEDGTPTPMARIQAGEVVGEMAVLDPAPRSASVVAATDCEVLELSRGGLLQLRRSAPSVSSGIVSGIIGDVTRRLRDVNARIDKELDPGKGRDTARRPDERAKKEEGSMIGRLWKRLANRRG
jgi:CRP-like cAMP-binding protein